MRIKISSPSRVRSKISIARGTLELGHNSKINTSTAQRKPPAIAAFVPYSRLGPRRSKQKMCVSRNKDRLYDDFACYFVAYHMQKLIQAYTHHGYMQIAKTRAKQADVHRPLLAMIPVNFTLVGRPGSCPKQRKRSPSSVHIVI